WNQVTEGGECIGTWFSLFRSFQRETFPEPSFPGGAVRRHPSCDGRIRLERRAERVPSSFPVVGPEFPAAKVRGTWDVSQRTSGADNRPSVAGAFPFRKFD
ncbi:MAG: hypothetical protein Q8O19_02430, partial [Rectinemataceae bacterium]|nr:hypothetical protein [Rectinemataceae bacterium]